MSYILDALRKSEARRRMGQPPGLDDARNADTAGRRRRGLARYVLTGVGVVTVVAVAGVAYLNRDLIEQRLVGPGSEPGPESTAEQPVEPVLPLAMDEEEAEHGEAPERTDRSDRVARSEREPTDRPGPDGRQRERVVSDPEEIEAELARRVAEDERDEALAQRQQDSETDTRRVRRAPETRVTAPAPTRRQPAAAEELARSEEIERRLREIEARQRRQEPESEVAARPTEPEPETTVATPDDELTQADEPTEVARTVTPQSPAEPWRPGGPEYVRVWELPLSIRRDLPELKLSIHVYSREEQRRFVLVNGQRFTSGDTITSGVRLAEIRPEGAVIDYRNYRFLLEP